MEVNELVKENTYLYTLVWDTGSYAAPTIDDSNPDFAEFIQYFTIEEVDGEWTVSLKTSLEGLPDYNPDRTVSVCSSLHYSVPIFDVHT